MAHIFAGVSSGVPARHAGLVRRCASHVKNVPWYLQSKLWGIPFQHVYLRFQLAAPNCPLNLVCHTTFSSGFDVLSLEAFLAHRKVHEEIRIEVSDEQFCRFLRRAFHDQGLPYSRKQLIGVGLVRFVELCTLKKYQPKRNWLGGSSKEQICSETGVRMLLHTCPELFEGRVAFGGRDPELVAPAEFYHEMLWLAAHRSDRVRFSTREKYDGSERSQGNDGSSGSPVYGW